jgi:hypothetical protein
LTIFKFIFQLVHFYWSVKEWKSYRRFDKMRKSYRRFENMEICR